MTAIDLDRLVDPKSLNAGHDTFLAFPRDSVGDEGLPEDLTAQEYIAAIQSAGIPVGIWIDTPTKDATAFVGPDHIDRAAPTLRRFRKSGRFPQGYDERLTNRLAGGANGVCAGGPKKNGTALLTKTATVKIRIRPIHQSTLAG